jgi:hemerythrin superfamily protein
MQKYTPQTPGGGTKNAIIAGAAGFGLGLLAAAGRKAAVQAVTYAAGDWDEGLKAEHKMATTILEAMEQTDETDLSKRRGLLFQLQHALGKHAIQEEDIVYCALRDAGLVEEADKLNHDHGYIKQYLYDIEMSGFDSPRYAETARKLKALIGEHVQQEENVLFPRLKASLSEEQNKKLTNRMNREGFKVA